MLILGACDVIQTHGDVIDMRFLFGIADMTHSAIHVLLM